MKTKFFLFALLAVFITMSCSDNDENLYAGFPVQRDTTFVCISRTVGVKNADTPVPLYMIETGGNMVSEIYVPEMSDSMLLLNFMGQNSNDDMTVIVTRQNIIMMNCRPHVYGLPSSVLVASADDGFSSLNYGYMNWNTGEFNPTQRVSLGVSTRTRASKKDDMESVRKLLYDHLTELSSNISELGDFLPKIPSAINPIWVCRVWTHLAIPVAKRMLYEPDVKMYEKEFIDYIADVVEDQIISFFFEDEEDQQRAGWIKKYGSRALIWAKDNVDGYYQREKEADYSPYQSSGLQAFNQIGVNTTRVNRYIFTGSLVEASKCIPSVDARDITENSMTLSGSFYFASEAATSNFVCYGVGYTVNGPGMSRTFNGSLQGEMGIAPYTITGLQPASTYYVTSYYKTMSDTYYSDVLKVTTRGILFEVSNNKVSFPRDGGSAVVNYTIGEQTTCKVQSSPKWVSTNLDTENNRLLITVSSSKNGHEPGEIVLVATNKFGETATRTITVSQSNSDWDGTTWDLVLNYDYKRVTTNNSGTTTNTEKRTANVRLAIHSMENQDFTLSGDVDISNCEKGIAVDNKGNLTLVYGYGDSGSYSNGTLGGASGSARAGTIQLTRKGSSVTGTYKYIGNSAIVIGNSYNYYETTESGTVKGTLVAE